MPHHLTRFAELVIDDRRFFRFRVKEIRFAIIRYESCSGTLSGSLGARVVRDGLCLVFPCWMYAYTFSAFATYPGIDWLTA